MSQRQQLFFLFVNLVERGGEEDRQESGKERERMRNLDYMNAEFGRSEDEQTIKHAHRTRLDAGISVPV
jgi:hypothetical protein